MLLIASLLGDFVRPGQLRRPEKDSILKRLPTVGLNELSKSSILKHGPQVEVAFGTNSWIDFVAIVYQPIPGINTLKYFSL